MLVFFKKSKTEPSRTGEGGVRSYPSILLFLLTHHSLSLFSISRTPSPRLSRAPTPPSVGGSPAVEAVASPPLRQIRLGGEASARREVSQRRRRRPPPNPLGSGGPAGGEAWAVEAGDGGMEGGGGRGKRWWEGRRQRQRLHSSRSGREGSCWPDARCSSSPGVGGRQRRVVAGGNTVAAKAGGGGREGHDDRGGW